MDKKNFYLQGIKKFTMLFLTCLATLTILAVCGAFPTIYAQVEGGSDFKDIQGCFYSLTPSSQGFTVNGTQNNGGQKYCYSLVDEGSNNATYKYLSDTNGDVYAFEYYTYLENNAMPTQKIAVYSKVNSLTTKTLGDGTVVYQDADENLYKSISDYLFYYVRKFTPNWQDTNTFVYSGDTLVSKTEGYDSYYSYEKESTDFWNEYKNLDVLTRYKFDLTGNGGNVIYYEGVTYDPDTDTVKPTGTSSNGQTDGSVYQIITRNDTNVVTYVLKQQGDAYVLTDMNGKKKGEPGFSTNTYYMGNQVFVYNDAIETSNADKTYTVSGFKIYTLTGETKTFDQLKDWTASSGYSLISFDKNNSPLMEAIRYYNMYEITYELKQTEVAGDTVTNQAKDQITPTVNQEFVYDNNGNPTAYDVTYTYNFEYYTGSTYTVTYKVKGIKYTYNTYDEIDNKTYSLQAEGFSDSAQGKPLIVNNKYVDLSNYSANSEFYALIGQSTENDRSGLYNFSLQGDSIPFENKTYNNQYTKYFYSSENIEDCDDKQGKYSSNGSPNISKTTWEHDKYEFNGQQSKTISATGYEIDGILYQNTESYWGETGKTIYTDTQVNITTTQGETKAEFLTSDPASKSVGTNSGTYYNKTSNKTGVVSYTADVYTISITKNSKHAIYRFWNDFKAGVSWLGNYYYYSCSYKMQNTWHGEDGGGSLDNWYCQNYARRSSGDSLSSKIEDAVNNVSTRIARTNIQFEGCDWHEEAIKNSGWTSVICYEGSKKNDISDSCNGNPNHMGNTNIYKNSYFVYWDEYEIKVSKSTQTVYSKNNAFYGSYDENGNLSDSLKTTLSTSNFNYKYAKNFSNKKEEYKYTEFTTTVTRSDGYRGYDSSYDGHKNSTLPSNVDDKFTQGGTHSWTYYTDFGSSKEEGNICKFKNGVRLSWRYSTVSLPDFTNIKINYSDVYFKAVLNDISSDTIQNNLKSSNVGMSTTNGFSGFEIFQNGNSVTDMNSIKFPTTSKNDTQVSAEIVPELVAKKTITFDSGDNGGFSFTFESNPLGNRTKALIVSPVQTPYNVYIIYTLKVSDSFMVSNTLYQSEDVNSWYDDKGVEQFDKAVPGNKLIADWHTITNLSTYDKNTDRIDGSNLTNIQKRRVANIIKEKATVTTQYEYYHTEKVFKENISKTEDIIQNSPDYDASLNSSKYDSVVSSIENKYYQGKYITFTVQNWNSNTGTVDANRLNQEIKNAVGEVATRNIVQTSHTEIPKYSGRYKGYKFDTVPTKSLVEYGSNSKSFGTNNVSVSSTYTGSKNTTYDYFVANKTWNGQNPTQTSYNKFDSDYFFKKYADNYYLRANVENGITTYTLKDSVTIDVANCFGANKGTLYISYYLNGVKKSLTMPYLSVSSSYKFTISKPAGANTYTVSRIMVSAENRDYTPYANITVNTHAWNGTDGYKETYIGYQTKLSYNYYETPYTFKAIITNYNDLINSDGSWTNKSVTYQISYNGVDRNGNKTQTARTFTYQNNNYSSELNLGNGFILALQPEKTEKLRYVLTREIYLVEGNYNGNFYNISEGQRDGNFDSLYYSGHKSDFSVSVNDKTSVKTEDGQLIEVDSLPGKLRLLQITNGLFTGDVYVRTANNQSKLIRVNGQNVYRYNKYYDDNKSLNADGITFTYLDKGYELTKDNSNEPSSNYVFDLIDLITNKQLSPENGKNTGLTKNNVFTDISNTVGLISFKDNENKTEGKTEYSDSSKYNEYDRRYTADNETDNLSYRAYIALYDTPLPFLLLASNSLDLTRDLIYTDKDNNHYKLFDASEMLGSYTWKDKSEVGYTSYDVFVSSGAWQRIDDLDAFVQNETTIVDNKPIKISTYDTQTHMAYLTWEKDGQGVWKNVGFKYKDGKIVNDRTYPFIEAVYVLDNLYLYKIKSGKDTNDPYLSYVPESYRGKYVTEKPGAYILDLGNNESKIVFDSTNNVKDEVESPYKDNTNYIDDLKTVFENRSGTLNVYGSQAKAPIYLQFAQKIPMYYFLKSENYILDYYSSDSDADKYAQLDMRYQFNTIDEEVIKFIEDGNSPILLFGDSLQEDSLTTYNYYMAKNEGDEITTNSIKASIFNGIMTDDKIKGGLKAGYVYNNGKKIAEKLYYGGSVYYLGNFIDGTGASAAGNDSFYRELREYIQKYYEYALSRVTSTNSIFSFYNKENKKFTGFLEAVPSTYDEFADNLGKTYGISKEKAYDTILTKYFNYSKSETEPTDYVPLLDMTSNFFNVSINLLTKEIKVTFRENLIEARSKSLHYIQLGNYIYYRQEESNHEAVSLDKIYSYLGVDLAVDAGQGTSAGGNSEQQTSEAIGYGALAAAGLVMCLIPGGQIYGAIALTYGSLSAASIGVLKLNQRFAANLCSSALATVAYSPLVKGSKNVNETSPYVTLNDILHRANETRYFVEIIAGSGEGTWVKNSNSLPTVNVELKWGEDSSKNSITKGFKTFAFSGDDSPSRYILSNSPRNLVITQCNNFGDWVTGGAGQMNIPSKIKMYVSNKRNREAYWDKSDEDTNVYYKVFNTDGTKREINLNNDSYDYGENINLGKENVDIIIPSSATETFTGKNGEFSRKLNRATITDSLDGTFIVTGGLAAGDLQSSDDFLSDFISYATNGVTHVTEWATNVIQSVGHNIGAWLRHFTHDDVEYVDIPAIFTYNYRLITFYNFRYQMPTGFSDNFEIQFNTTDTDYTSNANYNVIIHDVTGLEKPSVYAYQLYYTYNKELDTAVEPGFVYSSDGNCYYNDKSATSHVVDSVGKIKNVIQQSTKGEAYKIENLAPKKNLILKIFSAKTANYNTIATNQAIRTNTSNTDTATLNKPKDKDMYFSFYTSANYVYNPYGTDAGKRKTILKDAANSGDKYLLNNDYIDYDISKFIYGLTSFKHPTSNIVNSPSESYSFSYVDMKAAKNDDNMTYYTQVAQTLNFSGRYLAQKYLETSNISRIVFGLRIKEKYRNSNNETFNNYLYGYNNINAEVAIYSHKLNKYVLGSSTKGVKLVTELTGNNSANSASAVNGMFEYVLSDADKAKLEKEYSKDVTSFVNNYLLDDNFEFKFKNLFNSEDADNIFNIVWQPYYENTMTYLNLNQSFEKKSDGSLNLDIPTYDNDTTLDGIYYDINGQAVKSEKGTYAKGNYSHIEATNAGLSNPDNNLGGWNIGKISLTDTKSVKFFNITELGVVYTNKKDVFISLCIITNGESHIYS